MSLLQWSSSSGQITGGSHQEIRPNRVRDISRTALGESHNPCTTPGRMPPLPSRPCGRELSKRTSSTLRFAPRKGADRRGSRTATSSRSRLLPAKHRSSRSHSVSRAVSSGSRRSIRNTDVPGLGCLFLGRGSARSRPAATPATEDGTDSVQCQGSSSYPTRRKSLGIRSIRGRST
jgi:hypothetical protein